MKQVTHRKKTDIQWSLTEYFEDDIALLSQSQEKTTQLETPAAGLGLEINTTKTQIRGPDPRGGYKLVCVKARTGKTRNTFNMLNKSWKTKNTSVRRHQTRSDREAADKEEVELDRTHVKEKPPNRH